MNDKLQKIYQLDMKPEETKELDIGADRDALTGWIEDGILRELLGDKADSLKDEEIKILENQIALCSLATWFRDNLFRFLQEGSFSSANISLSIDSHNGAHQMSVKRTVKDIIDSFIAKELDKKESK